MGSVFKVPGMIIFAVSGIWGFILCLGIVTEVWGFFGTIVAFMFFPITLTAAPWYEALANENWFPVLLIYGGGLAAFLLMGIGSAIDGE